MDEMMNNKMEDNVKEGGWIYVRIFCSFFSLIASFACVLTLAEIRTNYGSLIMGIWGLGVIAALVVAPLRLFKAAFSIMTACFGFGLYLMVFPFNLLLALMGGILGGAAGGLVVVAVPAVFTIYTYFTDLRWECEDSKKKLVSVCAGIGSALAVIILFFVLNGATKSLEVPKIQEAFNAVESYKDYVESEGIEQEYADEVIANPTSRNFEEEGYVCVSVYDFSGEEEGIIFDYHVTMTFEYAHKRWEVTMCEEEKVAKEIQAISGSWSGLGTYGANLSSNNVYTCTFDNVTMQSGTGTFRISLEGSLDELRNFTIASREIQMEYNSETGKNDKAVMVMTLALDAPFTYEFFGGESSYSEIECKYYFAENKLWSDTITSVTMTANE